MPRQAFIIPMLPLRGRHRLTQPRQSRRSRHAQPVQHEPRAEMSVKPGFIPAASGSALLTLLLTNRFLTPLTQLTPQQSRADLLGVATSAVLLLYGLTRLEITPTNKPVELDGTDMREGFTRTPASGAVEWALEACLQGGEHVQSAAVVGGGRRYMLGRFREGVPGAGVREGGIVEGALRKGERVYLADLKVVSAKEVEFWYLPERTQAVLIVPIGSCVLVLGANKARPLRGLDFGWIQAVANRIGEVLEGG